MTPAAVAAFWGLVAGAPFIVLGVATGRHVRAEPYSRRWRRAQRVRRVCRGLSLPSYAVPALLYAVAGSAWWSAWWFVLFVFIAWAVAWNRRMEVRLRESVAALVQVQTSMLETWHEVWRRWDEAGRPTEGDYYEIVRYWPVPSESTWGRDRTVTGKSVG